MGHAAEREHQNLHGGRISGRPAEKPRPDKRHTPHSAPVSELKRQESSALYPPSWCCNASRALRSNLRFGRHWRVCLHRRTVRAAQSPIRVVWPAGRTSGLGGSSVGASGVVQGGGAGGGRRLARPLLAVEGVARQAEPPSLALPPGAPYAEHATRLLALRSALRAPPRRRTGFGRPFAARQH